MNNQIRDFLKSLRPPYFDAFYFVDEAAPKSTYVYPHIFFKVLYFIEGDVSYVIGDTSHTPIPGDILLLPRFTPYYCYSQNQLRHRRFVVWFTEELIQSIDHSGTLLAFFKDSESIQNGRLLRLSNSMQTKLFDELSALATERDYSKPLGDAVSHALITLILSDIYRATSVNSDKQEDDGSLRLVQELVAYINENLPEDLSLDLLAQRFFVSKYHLERIFKKHMSVTIHNYIVQRRLAIAKQKLYDGISPSLVSSACGFSTYTTFYRAFLKMYGITPKEFADQAAQLLSYNGSRTWDTTVNAARNQP